MTKHTFFETPTQLKFWDVDGECYLGGIGYQNEIICGCCGGIIDPNEVYESVPSDVKEPIVLYDIWVDIEAGIRGDDDPCM